MAKAKSKIEFYNTERSCFISIRTSVIEHLHLKSGDSIYKFSNSDSIYFIKIVTDKGEFSQKFIKE